MKINTLQEAKQFAFNKAVRGLSSQEWQKCMMNNDEGSSDCAFNNGVQGFHCAIGWLIPEDKQEDLRQDESALELKQLGVYDPSLQEWLNSDSSYYVLCNELLRDMMMAHDKSLNSIHMRLRFAFLVRQHNLKWPADVAAPEGLPE